jgi:hypothetical protein
MCSGAVGVSFQGDDVGVVDEAVDGGCGYDVVAVGFAPREKARLDVTTTEPTRTTGAARGFSLSPSGPLAVPWS